MRILLLSLALVAAPATAQSTPKAADRPSDTREITRILNDPAMAQRMTNVLQVLSKSFLDLPAGEIEAAVEGRAPTTADKRRTVRDIGREDDPDFDRDFQRQMAESGPVMQSAMKALAGALPAMMKGMEEAGRAMERATANLPSPTYPKR
jgi:hypothetical protein